MMLTDEAAIGDKRGNLPSASKRLRGWRSSARGAGVRSVIDISLEDFHSGIPISIIKSTACLYELCSDKTTRVAALPSALRPCPAVLPPPATATYLERVSLKAAP